MSAETRACELLCTGRVHVADIERAVVAGRTGPHLVQLVGETWTCDCESYRWRSRCAHVTAVRMLTRPPP